MKKTDKMKITRLGAVLFLLLYSLGCSYEYEKEDPGLTLERVSFRLKTDVPPMLSTRSAVSGAEGIYAMQLLCFDRYGLYVGLGAVHMTPSDSLHCLLTGSVPASTAVIHFIANAGLIPQEGWRGLSETELVGSFYSTVSHTHVIYWGCHREATAEAMSAWLRQDIPPTVSLLRDRAKITMDEPDPDWNHATVSGMTEHIISVGFAVCNGLTSGMTAPYDRATLSFSYGAPLTLPRQQDRYPGSASELVSSLEAQYLFEDENTLESPVKVILETVYEISDGLQTRQTVKYHQVMLMKEDYTLFQIHRNHQYNIIIGNLPSSIAYNTFAEALEGNPSNNQTVFVREIIPQISSGSYSIHILKGTSQIFQKETEQQQRAVIEFSFLKDGLPDPDIDADNFSVTWLSNKYVAYPNAALEIEAGQTPGIFRLLIDLYRPITDDLKSGKILLQDRTYGLARYISIYSITAFDFKASLQADTDPDNPYRLVFQIPDNYPAALFPFAVRVATEDFKPTVAQNADKALAVLVEDTYSIIGTDWEYWYAYEVSAPGTYQIRLSPVSGRSGELSIYLYADYFGELDSQGDMICNYVKLEENVP